MPTDEERSRVRVELGGVPETLLWNLYHRALAAREPGRVLDDPKAIELVESIDYPFDKLADRTGYAAGWHAWRVRRFDDEVRRFVGQHPEGTVVALGEGLETQFWRVDNGAIQWLTVDLPEAVAAREQLLADGPRQHTLACSALDDRCWTRDVDPSRGLLITAQGLLMYFDRPEVDRLVRLCGRRFPGSELIFDAVPEWMLRASERRRARRQDEYEPPAWEWGLSAAERRRLAALPEVADLHEPPLPRRGGLLLGTVLPALHRLPGVRDRLPVFPLLRVQLTDGP